jgi:hypothetical protein
VNDTTAYVITDTPRAGHIEQITGRLVTLVDGTRYVAASQQMIHIDSCAGCTWPKQCGEPGKFCASEKHKKLA